MALTRLQIALLTTIGCASEAIQAPEPPVRSAQIPEDPLAFEAPPARPAQPAPTLSCSELRDCLLSFVPEGYDSAHEEAFEGAWRKCRLWGFKRQQSLFSCLPIALGVDKRTGLHVQVAGRCSAEVCPGGTRVGVELVDRITPFECVCRGGKPWYTDYTEEYLSCKPGNRLDRYPVATCIRPDQYGKLSTTSCPFARDIGIRGTIEEIDGKQVRSPRQLDALIGGLPAHIPGSVSTRGEHDPVKHTSYFVSRGVMEQVLAWAAELASERSKSADAGANARIVELEQRILRAARTARPHTVATRTTGADCQQIAHFEAVRLEHGDELIELRYADWIFR